MKKVLLIFVSAVLLVLLSLVVGSIWFNLSMSHGVWAPSNYVADWFGVDGEVSYDVLWWEQTFISLSIFLIFMSFLVSRFFKKKFRMSFFLITSISAIFLNILILLDIVFID